MSLSAVHHPVVRVVDVVKRFGDGAHGTTAVRGIRLEALAGELVLLVGPSGSGKTTLLTLIAGLSEPSSGGVSLFGLPLVGLDARARQRLRSERIGFVFQTFLLIDALPVMENVAIVAGFAGRPRRDARRRAAAMLDEFGVTHLADRSPATLSPGEKQRIALARAFVNEPGLVLADEPTASLDAGQGLQAIEALQRYAKERGGCVMVASHDLRLVPAADRVFRLMDGVLIAETRAEASAS